MPSVYSESAWQLAKDFEHFAIEALTDGLARGCHVVLADTHSEGDIRWTFAEDAVVGDDYSLADGFVQWLVQRVWPFLV